MSHNQRATDLYHPSRIRSQLDQWLQHHPQNTLITLTYDQTTKTGQYITSPKTQPHRAYEAMRGHFREFMHLLNLYTLKSAYKRYQKRLPMLPVIEGNGIETARHFHTPTTKPEWLTARGFETRIKNAWRYGSVHVITDEGDNWFQRYCNKLSSKDTRLSYSDHFLFEFWTI